MSKWLDFKTVDNIRDLGGIKTSDGKVVKDHMIIRSAALNQMSKEEYEYLLKEYDLKLILDFRTHRSFTNKKDMIDNRVKNYNLITIPFLDHQGYNHDIPCKPECFFTYVYLSLATLETSHEAYRSFFRHIIDQKEGGILWHCTSGKDRTGIATYLFMHALGCNEEECINEYLKTNEYTSKVYDRVIKELQAKNELTPKERDWQETNYIANLDFFNSWKQAIVSQFNTVDNYIEKILGITKNDKEILRKRYLI